MPSALSTLDTLSDEALIQTSLNGEPQAFPILLKRYLKPVYRYIYGMVSHHQLADDLTQETFIRLYKALEHYNPNKPFKPWLFTIATNVCKTALSKQTRHLQVVQAYEQTVSPTPNNEPLIEESLTPKVYEALTQLPEGMRQALLLRHIEELPYETIAQVLQTNKNTIRTWLKRGRERLKTALETLEDPLL